MRRYERTLPNLLLLPSIAFMLIFFAWPLVEAMLVAFGDEAGGWTLDHFRQMADDINYGEALRNTLLLVVIVVPIQLVLAIGLAQFC